jgi:hypothetical protein
LLTVTLRAAHARRLVFEKRLEPGMTTVRPGVRAGLRRDLAALPAELATGAMARSALLLAQMLDSGERDPREAATLVRELRLTMVALAALAPARAEGGIVDELRARRTARTAAG